jgi:hypothetical protein
MRSVQVREVSPLQKFRLTQASQKEEEGDDLIHNT